MALVPAFAAPGIASAVVEVKPTGFQQRTVLTGLDQPTAVRFAPNSDRSLVFVAEKRGTIQVFEGLQDTTPAEVINLRREVYNNGDRGLLGLAVDPDFPASPYIYALYTRDASFAGTTGAASDDVAARHLTDNPPTDPDTSDGDSDCNGQLYGEFGCEAAGRLVRIQVNPLTGVKEPAAPAPNPKPLVSGWCQQFSTHSVGDLHFGVDGQLYVSGGDGAGYDTVDVGQFSSPCPDREGEGGAMRAQDSRTPNDPNDPTALNGAILRVDPDTGAASPGNPFTVGDPNQRRIIGYGLRNPYRFAVQPGTNDLWLGDVGWGKWEEINRIPDVTQQPQQPARDFGWPCYEGDWQDNNPNQPYENYDPDGPATGIGICHGFYDVDGAGVTPPFFSYFHTQVEGQCFPTQFRDDYNQGPTPFHGAAITGLTFYAGGDYPDSYDGGLFFGDYARGCLFFVGATNGVPDPAKVVDFAHWDPDVYDPVYVPADIGVVGLELGPGGDVFITDIANGTVRRVLYGAVDARAGADVTSGPTPLTVTFDASASTTTGPATITKYEWDLDGNGSFETDRGTLATVEKTFTQPGVTNVKVRVTDSSARTGVSDAVKIEAGKKPVVIIESPSTSPEPWAVGDQLAFAGKAYDGEGAPLDPAKLTWDLVIRHCTTSGDCHSHFVGGSLSGLDGGRHGTGGTFIAPDHSYPSHLELQLTAKDADGLSTTVTRRLDPETVDIALASDPAGRTLTANDRTAAAPFICTVIKGSQTTLSATLSETAAGRTFTFDAWSNGGSATQTFTALASQSLTARYTASPLPAGVTPAGAAPSGAAPQPGIAPAAPKDPIRRGGTLRVSRNGTVSLRARCRGTRPCRASVRLDTDRASSASTRTLAKRVVKRIDAGRSTVVRVRLSPAARRLLARRRSLQAIATVTVTPSGRPAVTTRTRYTLRPARR